MGMEGAGGRVSGEGGVWRVSGEGGVRAGG